MPDILEVFPELSDTDASAIAYAFERWWETDSASLSTDERRAALVGFAAGWIKRPTSDF